MPDLVAAVRVIATPSELLKRTWTCTGGVPGTNAVLVPPKVYSRLLRRERELLRLLRKEQAIADAAAVRRVELRTQAVLTPSFSCRYKRKKKSNAQTNQTTPIF